MLRSMLMESWEEYKSLDVSIQHILVRIDFMISGHPTRFKFNGKEGHRKNGRARTLLVTLQVQCSKYFVRACMTRLQHDMRLTFVRPSS